MREILFRGKRIDNGEWVEGYYYERMDTLGKIIEAIIIVDAYEQITSGQRYIRSNIGYECFRVDPVTVGQYTGMNDKNGKKIFEGDMVVSYSLFGHKDGCGVVNWSDLFAAWNVGENNMYGRSLANYEIIGNIHDSEEVRHG